MAERINVKITDIKSKVKGILEGLNVPATDAEIATSALLDAEVSGVESHGLTRLKAYADGLANGKINPTPDIDFKVNGVVMTVDGGNGLGQVVTDKSLDKCIEMAKKYGVGIATIKHSNHFGTAAYYANKFAQAGCIGISATNAGPTTAPFGGMSKILGTNPFSLAFPAEKNVFCADMATSAVAKGKIRIYAKKGQQIPLGWAIDVDGNDTTDPEAAIKGILLPMAAHKGYALAMIVDALCGLLSGANLSCESISMVDVSAGNKPANTGHFLCAIDIEHFLPLTAFEGRAQGWFDKIKASKPRPGMKIMIPGEPEANLRAKRIEEVDVLAETVNMVDEYYSKYKHI